jgi:molecular chaperone HscB
MTSQGCEFRITGGSCLMTSGSSSSSDYFNILGVERTFVQSPDELKTKYKSLMTKFHPDRHTTSSDEIKIQQALLATNVTRAYSVIEDPLTRALHLLELHGHTIGGESDQSSVAMSNAFLMEIMEAREEVEHASTDAQLKPLLNACQLRQSQLCLELEKSFNDHSVDDAKLQTAQLQYWRRIEETILDKITSTE